MKILMIGGTRFFGKRFVQRMLDQNHSVTLLTRGLTEDNFGNRVSRLVADRKDPLQLKNSIKSEYDIAIDNMLMNAEEASDIISVLRDRIGHFIMTSTLSVYESKSSPLTESDFQATKIYSGNDYQHGKRSAEYKMTQAPFDVSIMRIPMIVGKDDYTGRLLKHVKAVSENQKFYFPNPAAKFSYLHARDAARALNWLCDTKQKGVFNISAPNAWSLKELMNCIEKISGKSFSFGDSTDETSPFGITEDFYMNVDKAASAGFTVDSLENWMPNLLQELTQF